MSTLLAGIDLADRDYWLGHCERFRVEVGGRRSGIVEYVRYGSDPGVPDSIHVRTGLLRVREVEVPIEDVEQVDPPTRTIRVRALDDMPAAAPAWGSGWLRRAGLSARWSVQRG